MYIGLTVTGFRNNVTDVTSLLHFVRNNFFFFFRNNVSKNITFQKSHETTRRYENGMTYHTVTRILIYSLRTYRGIIRISFIKIIIVDTGPSEVFYAELSAAGRRTTAAAGVVSNARAFEANHRTSRLLELNEKPPRVFFLFFLSIE